MSEILHRLITFAKAKSIDFIWILCNLNERNIIYIKAAVFPLQSITMIEWHKIVIFDWISYELKLLPPPSTSAQCGDNSPLIPIPKLIPTY